jgi:hypothetical protein
MQQMALAGGHLLLAAAVGFSASYVLVLACTLFAFATMWQREEHRAQQQTCGVSASGTGSGPAPTISINNGGQPGLVGFCN